MTDKVIKSVYEHNMLVGGENVGVGVSGGADSVALLCFLQENKQLLGIKSLTAVHVNHSIRGDEADRDMRFTEEICKKIGVLCKCVTVDVPAEAEKTGESTETCARRLRYDVFESFGFDKFATAHNLNDRMETFFFNLARGASSSGLLSIPYVRGIFIRPLLDVTRDEIEQYLAEKGIDFVVDSTNNGDDYTRNKIRHNLIPMMYELNPVFHKAFLKCERSLEEDGDYINKEANKLLSKSENGGELSSKYIKRAPKALRHRSIALFLKKSGVKNITREHISQIDHIISVGGRADVCGNTLKCEQGVVSFGKEINIPDFSVEIQNFTDTVKTPVGNFKIISSVKKDLQFFNKQAFNNLIDCDKIEGKLKVRSRMPGDRIKLSGRGVTKTLKQLFNEKKIPASKRKFTAIVSDDSGIVWLEGFGVCRRCAVGGETQNIVEFMRIEG